MKKFFILSAIVILLLSVSCFSALATSDSVEVIEVTVRVRDVVTLRPQQEGGRLENLRWETSNESIVQVHSAGGGTSGNITGVTPGTAYVKCYFGNKLMGCYMVTVDDAPLPNRILIEPSYYIVQGEEIDISFTLSPENATSLYDVKWDNTNCIRCSTTGGHTGVRIYGESIGVSKVTIFASNNIILSTLVYVISADSEMLQINDDQRCYVQTYFDSENQTLTIKSFLNKESTLWAAQYDRQCRMFDIQCITLAGKMIDVSQATTVKVFALTDSFVPLGRSIELHNSENSMEN